MPYNQANYNDQRYDIDGIVYATSLIEDVTSTEVTTSLDIKLITELITLGESTLLFAIDPVFSDFLFLDENLNIQVTNKALNDTVRLADWLSIERNPINSGWYD